MDINFKKLILFTMRMNESEKTTLKMTGRRIVNMEMFANVCKKKLIIIIFVFNNHNIFILEMLDLHLVFDILITFFNTF